MWLILCVAAAFPFDQHALRVSISCTTCSFAPLSTQVVSYVQGGYIHGEASTPVKAASFGNTNVTLLENASGALSGEAQIVVLECWLAIASCPAVAPAVWHVLI